VKSELKVHFYIKNIDERDATEHLKRNVNDMLKEAIGFFPPYLNFTR